MNVKADGFLNSYGTHLIFDRLELGTPEYLRRAVQSIHHVKLGSLSDHELIMSQEIMEFVADNVSHLYELEREGTGFCWQHSTNRRIDFVKNYNKPLKVSSWNEFTPDNPDPEMKKIEVSLEIMRSSREFTATIEYDEQTA